MAPFKGRSEAELIAGGYVFEGKAKCKGKTCGAEIEFWRTPKGHLIPLTPGTGEPHFATCPNERDFRDY